jgi:hypothetical protein
MPATNDTRADVAPQGEPEALSVPEAAPRPRRAAGDPDEWTEHDGKHAELVELRASAETLREQLEELTGELERGRGRELALRGALQRLAAAGPFRRRAVLDDLRRRQLLR